MITLGTTGRGEVTARNYSSQAVERRVYDSPKERLMMGTVLKSSKESVGPGAKSPSPTDTTARHIHPLLETDLGATMANRRLDGAEVQGAADSQEDGEGEGQDNYNRITPASQLDTAKSDSMGVRSFGSDLQNADPTDSKSVSSASIEEPGVQDDWQEFEKDPDAENRDGFQEYESDQVETLEDLDLLRALNKRTSNGDMRTMNLQVQHDPQLQQDLQQEPINRAIHILGLGAAGKYIAHSLASLPFPPPITLLMHRPLVMQHWHDEGAAIHVIKGGKIKTQTNFHIESSASFFREDSRQRFPGFGPRLEHTSEPPNYSIDALIVTTEAYRTVSALMAIRHRLGRKSTIFILNNGLGLVERINEKVFPDFRTRPTYILGNMSHNLQSTERHFTLIEKSPGRLECSKLPQVSITRKGNYSPTFTRKDFSWSAPASHLVGILARTPEFSTVTLGHKSFYESQFQNLAAGCIIGPLSVLFDCTNDLLLYNFSASQAMKLLLREISYVICSLPELQSLPDLEETFGVRRLEAIIVSKMIKSGKNLSTMLQSIRAGNRTNIDYYNGYIERRAKELGIDTPRNQMMLHLVKGKSAAKSRELNNFIPFEDDC